ncbi:SusC/RagA family TonB-linked outer membrane protein [Pinibacter aurantiacus]|uniref:TonB-dependent receptor n=1 Tax=Pinibacter aurantiacus TaxID=2851599 RepID=A0A9E2W9P7_9BACT|nr:TonB-dependent receptor [Pinibacter aurantiacus]MBV4360406.1 TonB-dependent receptor [Pinibacter aurantiacus]
MMHSEKTNLQHSLLLKRLLPLLLALGLFFFGANKIAAQTADSINVKGHVVSATGEPIPDATVFVKGTGHGTNTGADGRFSINASSKSSLVISHIGYATQEVKVSSISASTPIQLVSSKAELDQIVVIGYGTQKKSDITGSVTSVPKDRLAKIPVTNVLQAVEGAVAGWTLTTSSAAPGQSAGQQVRGLNSITASTTPLIVLDGVPFAGTTNDISPNTIESIEVLKDASATAIYGTRGSSGVILITTKRGATGKPTISYSGFAGLENMAHQMKPMDAEAYKLKNITWQQQTGNTNSFITSDSVLNTVEVPNKRAGITTDWLKEISRQGYIQSHNLSFSGGTKDVKYFVNGEYTKDLGLLKGYQYTRVSFRSNLNANLTDWLSVGTSLFYTNNNNDGGHVDLTLAGQMSPYGQLYNADGSYAIFPMYGNTLYTNPLLGLNKPSLNRSNNLSGTGYVEVAPKFVKGLKYRLNGNYSYLPSRIDTYTGRNANNNNGAAYVYAAETTSWIIENILSYTKDIKKHHFDITGLYSAQKNSSFSSTINATGFINDGLGYNNTNAASTSQVTGTNSSKYTLISQMGRLNYSYDGRYLLTATVRRDGYSAFGAMTDKYGTFPSAAIGWNISNEGFMRNVALINSLKLRVSYGTTGNSAIDPYKTQTSQIVTQYVYNNQTATGLIANNLGNSGLKWESTTAANLGLDFSILSNRISGSIEYYQTKTKDLLLSRQIPIMTGYSSVLANIGKLENKGIDITLNTVNIRTGNFTWQTTAVFSTYKNKLTQLYGDGKDDPVNGWFIGKSLGAIYTYNMQGVWQVGEDHSTVDPAAKPGYLKFEDVDGNHVINANDRKIIGYKNPDWTGGLTNTFTYKNISLRIFIQTFQGAMKNNQIYDNADQSGNINLPADVGYWTADNKSNTRPSLAYTNATYSYAYPSNCSFTRLKDVTLSYTVSQKVVEKMGLSNFSVYVAGRNLHTWTPWLGWDPEANFQSLPAGTNYNNFPQVASYVLGINLSFK